MFTKTYFISSLENELLTSNLLQYIIMLRSILAIDSGGHASDLVFARNCSIARMLPGEAELVSEWTGLPGRAKSVKRFERSNGPDIALYKNYLYLFNIVINILYLWSKHLFDPPPPPLSKYQRTFYWLGTSIASCQHQPQDQISMTRHS